MLVRSGRDVFSPTVLNSLQKLTGKISNLKTFGIWVFLEKLMVLQKKTLNFIKVAKGDKFVSGLRLKWQNLFELSFSFLLDKFIAKRQKNLNLESLDTTKRVSSQKDAFIILTGIFNKLGGCNLSRSGPSVF